MKIGIIGLGLMGASFGKAIIKNTSHTVYGADIDDSVMLKAELVGAINFPLENSAYGEIDVLCIAVYPRSFEVVLTPILPKLKSGAVVIDLSGNKRAVALAMQKAKAAHPQLEFIATHPMAGREFWGVEHSTCGLFEKSSLIMIPIHTDIEKLTEIKELFTEIGVASVVISDAETHDRIIAYTSQLAHIASSSFVKSPTAPLHNGYSAGSFRDLTRVARLNADMWTELMIDNGDNLVPEIDGLIARLKEYRDALKNNDEKTLFKLLEDGNVKKEEIEKATRSFKRNRED